MNLVNSQSGFITIAFVVMAPLFLVLLLGTAWILWFLNQKHKLDNICYQHVLDSQTLLIEGNQRLLNLNPRASLLIMEKRALNHTIQFGPPPAKAVAIARKAIVVAQQTQLKAQQQGILKLAAFRSRAELQKLKLAMQSEAHKLSRFWRTQDHGRPTVTIHWKPSQTRVRIPDIAPVYKLSPQYERQQVHFVRWRIPIHRILPRWLSQIVWSEARFEKNWYGQCESHPHQGVQKWHSAIGAGKH